MLTRSLPRQGSLSRRVFMVLVVFAAILGLALFGIWFWPSQPEPGTFAPAAVRLKEVPGKNVKELQDAKLTFTDSRGVQWVAPKGTWTDGASVPRLALWVTDGRFDEAFLKAAIVHDAYCQDFNEKRCPEQYRKQPWKAVHRMFFEACVAGKTPLATAKLMFAAVWLGGPKWNDPVNDTGDVPSAVLKVGFQDCEEWIAQNDPDPEEIEGWMEKRLPQVVELSRSQKKAEAALAEGDFATANQMLASAETQVEDLPDQPENDSMLLVLKSTNHSLRATALQQQGLEADAQLQIKAAESGFKTMMERDPRNPVALHGLGKVRLLQGDLTEARTYVREALEKTADFPEATRDLEAIEMRINARQPIR